MLPTKPSASGGRFVKKGIAGLLDEPRPGVPRKITGDQVEAVVVKTLESTPRPCEDPCDGAWRPWLSTKTGSWKVGATSPEIDGSDSSEADHSDIQHPAHGVGHSATPRLKERLGRTVTSGPNYWQSVRGSPTATA